jgi:hypothetical protein
MVMIALVCIGFSLSYFYYKNVNNNVDPRIREARLLYEKYNSYAQRNHFDSVFWLMDTIESLYSEVGHYKYSYEVGVLHNNRSASYLTLALFDTTLYKVPQRKDSLMQLAAFYAQNSISIYENWLKKFGGLTNGDIRKAISIEFLNGLEDWDIKKQEAFLDSRVKEMELAQEETKRRLSVSYTNVGIMQKHHLEYEAAALTYKKAMDLWNRNLTAENNLNVLLGRPIKKRNLIQKMFPPGKNDL